MSSSRGYGMALGTVAVTLLVSVAACGERGGPAGAPDATSTEVSALWTQAFNAGDPAGLAALYADDARSMPPGGGTLSGRGAIEEYWRDDIGPGGAATTLTPTDTVTRGDVVHVQGAYQVVADGTELVRGHYQQLWTRSGAGWQIERDMWRMDPALHRETELADRLTARWTEAYNAADSEALAALYDENAELATQREGSVVGRSDIEGFWLSDTGASKPQTTLTLSDVYVAGDLAHLEGAYEVRDRNTVTEGKYVQLWMREGNEWRIHREMWWQ